MKENLWEAIFSSFFAEQGDDLHLFGQFLNAIVLHKTRFQDFFNKTVEGQFYQLYEGYFVHMPENLIEDGLFDGQIEIHWDNFDDKEHLAKIRLDMFYFYVKLAAIFHSNHVDQQFSPWSAFSKLDALQHRYCLNRLEAKSFDPESPDREPDNLKHP